MKGELSGVVGPVFVVADPIGSGFVAGLARPGGRRCWRRSSLPGSAMGFQSGDAGHNRAADGRWTGEAVPMTKPGTQASRCIFCKIASVVAPLAAGVVASPGPSCRRRRVGALNLPQQQRVTR
jgi:hypothetical protein